MDNRLSILISVCGVLAGTLFLTVAVREYRATGASTLWIGLAVVIFVSAVYALVRDVRRSRTRPSA